MINYRAYFSYLVFLYLRENYEDIKSYFINTVKRKSLDILKNIINISFKNYPIYKDKFVYDVQTSLLFKNESSHIADLQNLFKKEGIHITDLKNVNSKLEYFFDVILSENKKIFFPYSAYINIDFTRHNFLEYKIFLFIRASSCLDLYSFAIYFSKFNYFHIITNHNLSQIKDDKIIKILNLLCTKDDFKYTNPPQDILYVYIKKDIFKYFNEIMDIYIPDFINAEVYKELTSYFEDYLKSELFRNFIDDLKIRIDIESNSFNKR